MAGLHLSGGRTGASGGTRGTGGTLSLGSHGKVRKRGAAFVLCACLKGGREEAGARNNGPVLSFPASGVPSDRECSPEMWEIWTPLAWDLSPLPVLPLSV